MDKRDSFIVIVQDILNELGTPSVDGLSAKELVEKYSKEFLQERFGGLLSKEELSSLETYANISEEQIPESLREKFNHATMDLYMTYLPSVIEHLVTQLSVEKRKKFEEQLQELA